jgi:phage-related minor tail protein
MRTVNASKIGDSVGNDKKKLEAESKEALDLEKKLAEIKITDEGLKKLMEDYGKNLKDYADMMDKAAKTGESDLDGLMKLVKQASDVATKNSELTGKINSYCSGQSK